jgi:hypothetical protein
MGQILHGCATTTEAVRRAMQNSQASLRALAERYGFNQKLSRSGSSARPSPISRLVPRKSTVLSIEEEAIVVAFRRGIRCCRSTIASMHCSRPSRT